MSIDGSNPALTNSRLLVDVPTVVVVKAVVSVHLLRSASSIPHLWGATRRRIGGGGEELETGARIVCNLFQEDQGQKKMFF